MNVALGGTLYQDLSEFLKKVLKHLQGAERSEGTHHVSVDSGSILHYAVGERILVNSYHLSMSEGIRRFRQSCVTGLIWRN